MNKKIYIFLVFSLFSFKKVSAQFNTVRAKKTITAKIITTNMIQQGSLVSDTAASVLSQADTIVPAPLLPVTAKMDTSSIAKFFHLPILSPINISSHYGYRSDPFTNKRTFHYGFDLITKSENVYSIMPGRIKEIGFKKKGLGNYVIIDHGEFSVTYAHLHTSIGSEGNYVNAGTKIGISGSTGRSTGEHLHVSIKYKGKFTDPLPIITYISNYINAIET